MNRLVLIVLSVVALSVRAEVPPCYPGVESYQFDITGPMTTDPKVERFYPYIVTDNQDNCAAVWFCDAGHYWVRYWLAGHGNNLDNCAFPYAKATAALFATHAQKDQLWIDHIVNGVERDPVKQAQYQAQDAPAHALAQTVPVPTTVPPSGLVVQATPAFKLRRLINAAPVWVQIGTVPLGTFCDASLKLGPYYRVDRTLVKMSSKLADLPDSAWAKCDP